MKLWVVVSSCLVIATGCVGEDEEEGGGLVADSVCSSGLRWTGGNEESPLMHPGMDCVSCHAGGEGPDFLAAGTVYGQLDEPDDCAGIAGVTVQITDANGKTVTSTTNAAGNFYFDARTALAFPVMAKVQLEGREKMMSIAQSTGACASCHVAVPSETLPGRIVAP
ncbi:MAG TPA: hypothetical protein VFQ53_39165 [Kofleriaceae bacterium]|nr:hypothetical protein [Kofleriaceae bacterium]